MRIPFRLSAPLARVTRSRCHVAQSRRWSQIAKSFASQCKPARSINTNICFNNRISEEWIYHNVRSCTGSGVRDCVRVLARGQSNVNTATGIKGVIMVTPIRGSFCAARSLSRVGTGLFTKHQRTRRNCPLHCVVRESALPPGRHGTTML